MGNIIEQTIGAFLIRAVSAPGELEDGISVFVKYEDMMYFCDNFDQNMHAAKEFVKRQSKYKIKVVKGEFWAK